MNYKQIVYAIYNYLFCELSRLEIKVSNKSKYIQSGCGNSEYIYDYWNAKKELEHFKNFSESIFDILRFYDE